MGKFIFSIKSKKCLALGNKSKIMRPIMISLAITTTNCISRRRKVPNILPGLKWNQSYLQREKSDFWVIDIYNVHIMLLVLIYVIYRCLKISLIISWHVNNQLMECGDVILKKNMDSQ